MSYNKLSTSLSAHDLRNISSYREQRLTAKPPSSITDLGQQSNCWTARNDLENIQECLRNSLYKRRESYGDKDSLHLRHEPLDSVIGRLNREIEGINSPKASDYPIEEANRFKVLNKYVLVENSLNTIEENPRPQANNTKKDVLTMSLKTQSRSNLQSNKNSLVSSTTLAKQTANPIYKVTTPTNDPAKTLFTSKQSTKKPLTRPTTSYKPGVTKSDALRLSKKVQLLRDELQNVSFRKQTEIMGCLMQIIDYMREQ